MDIMKRVLRRQRLEREQLVGRPRSKSWDGKPDARKDRRDWNRQKRNDH